MTEKNKDAFRVGIAGLGTVGAGVIKMFQQNAEIIQKRAGRPIDIVCVTAGNKNKNRGVDIKAYEWCASLDVMAQDKRLDCVVELIGGADGAVKTFIEDSLSAGKHVVTANKALLAHQGFDLARRAEENNVTLRYEAAVAGGIPVIKMLRGGLAGNHIKSLYGILNGTCNYILTEMRETGRDFSGVLKEAQEKGYAEADPSFDVDGIDAAHKLSILSALAFGVKPDFGALSIKGIRRITVKDIEYADKLGYSIKLIGMASHEGGKVMQSMEPCLVPAKSALASVEGVYNAVYIDGDFVDKIMIEGRGAGEGPTASSVVADIIDLARGNFKPVFGVKTGDLQDTKWQGMDEVVCKTYIHFKVKDEAGVIADITACLKQEKVSIDSFLQFGHSDDGTASIVIVTQNAKYSTVKNAVSAASALSSMIEAPNLLRILEL